MSAVKSAVAIVCALFALSMPFASRAGVVKLMTFNIRHCAGMDGKLDVKRTAAAIAKESPQFVCLQEVDVRTKRSHKVDQAAELATLTGMKSTFAKAIPFGGGEYGVAVLSREDPLNVTKVPLPGKEPRVLLICEFKDFAVATAHLSVAGAKEREAAIPKIKAAFAKLPGKPVFFTGDWNADPDSEVLKSLRRFLSILSPQDGVRTFHGSADKGPDGKFKDVCIDYIAVDVAHAKDFSVKRASVVEDRTTSDHAPVVVELWPVK